MARRAGTLSEMGFSPAIGELQAFSTARSPPWQTKKTSDFRGLLDKN